MKVIIAGSRNIRDYETIKSAIEESGFDITEVVSGCANGVDKEGERWANFHRIPIRRFPADWELGKGAGAIRNSQMAMYAEALIAVWDGESRGTTDMIKKASKRGLPTHVKRL